MVYLIERYIGSEIRIMRAHLLKYEIEIEPISKFVLSANRTISTDANVFFPFSNAKLSHDIKILKLVMASLLQ